MKSTQKDRKLARIRNRAGFRCLSPVRCASTRNEDIFLLRPWQFPFYSWFLPLITWVKRPKGNTEIAKFSTDEMRAIINGMQESLPKSTPVFPVPVRNRIAAALKSERLSRPKQQRGRVSPRLSGRELQLSVQFHFAAFRDTVSEGGIRQL